MYLSGLHYSIIVTYFLIVLGVGLWISKLARNNLDQYFLGGKKIKCFFWVYPMLQECLLFLDSFGR